jgi:tetratricopeptide (TPR) repeat protein
MHSPLSSRFLVLAAAIAASVATTIAAAQGVQDQDNAPMSDKHALVQKRPAKVVQLYPDATRKDPGITAALLKDIAQMHALVDASNDDAAIALGEKMLADPKASHFDKAAAYQGIGYASFGKRDFAKAADALQKCIAEDGLPNNDHYQAMYNLVVAQFNIKQVEAGVATLNRLVAETKLDKPEYNGLRGRGYFTMKDYVNAAQALEKSTQAAAKPDPGEQQMLLASYFELKQPERAVKLAEDIVRTHPDDKDAQLNLAAAYQQAGQADHAAAQLEEARKRGLLTQAKDYRQLYVLYSNLKGHEKDSIAAINEGLQKGILQPDQEVLTALAEDYYFGGQMPQAIDAYRKADAVSSDGEAALNLAKIYHNQGQVADARAMAEHALQKGVRNPGEARALLGDANGEAKKAGKKKK